MTTRARIRQTVIDGMDENEIRDLVSRMHTAIDEGYHIDEDTLEEHIGEVLSERDDASTEKGGGS